MFDRLDSLSDELLAAYLDGNTTPEAVSYTHLDVYKRQKVNRSALWDFS